MRMHATVTVRLWQDRIMTEFNRLYPATRKDPECWRFPEMEAEGVTLTVGASPPLPLSPSLGASLRRRLQAGPGAEACPPPGIFSPRRPCTYACLCNRVR
jgi:hypothetical protein